MRQTRTPVALRSYLNPSGHHSVAWDFACAERWPIPHRARHSGRRSSCPTHESGSACCTSLERPRAERPLSVNLYTNAIYRTACFIKLVPLTDMRLPATMLLLLATCSKNQEPRAEHVPTCRASAWAFALSLVGWAPPTSRRVGGQCPPYDSRNGFLIKSIPQRRWTGDRQSAGFQISGRVDATIHRSA